MNKRNNTTIEQRIAVRAYYMWQAGIHGDAHRDWCEAERVELALAAKRKASAVKAAATRKANKVSEWGTTGTSYEAMAQERARLAALGSSVDH